jgi:flagellar hook assembly protein FlgD
VRLAIYDLRGGLVRILHEGEQQPAVHRIVWDGVDAFGRTAGPGKYVCRLEADDYVGALPMILLE